LGVQQNAHTNNGLWSQAVTPKAVY